MAKVKYKRLTDSEREEQNIFYKPTYVGQNIKNIRSLKKITQQEMSERTYLSLSRICRIEKGAFADIEEYSRIASVLDVRLDMLIFYDHRISKEELEDEKNKFINKDYMLETVTIETIMKKREL